jgi:hypothetical protein
MGDNLTLATRSSVPWVHTQQMDTVTLPLNPTNCPDRTLLPARSATHPESGKFMVDAQCQLDPDHQCDHGIFQALDGDLWIEIPTRWPRTS